MILNNPKVLSGYEFVHEVILRNRFRAGDYLVSADGGECQWLEFKALVGVGGDDEDVQSLCTGKGMSVKDACTLETRRNLQRIAKSIISLHNTRGGCILIGICEENGVALPTVYSTSRDGGRTFGASCLGGLYRRVRSFFKGFVSIFKDMGLLRALDSLFVLRHIGGPVDRQRCLALGDLFERKILFFKGVPIIALVVKCAGESENVILYAEEPKGEFHLAFRQCADNEDCAWPLSVNQKQAFDEVWREAGVNDDLYQKIISLSCLNRPNPVLRRIDQILHLFDKSFVTSAVSYVFAHVPSDKLYARLKVSFLYYGIYFLIMNTLQVWAIGPRVLLSILILVGLLVAFFELMDRVEKLEMCIWVLIPAGMFALLGSVAPASPCVVYVSSAGLVACLAFLALIVKSPLLKTEYESAVLQMVTLFVYLTVTVVQFPFVLFAISESSRSQILNCALAFVVNMIPVVSSILASRIAMVYYDGFIVGCVLLFYLPYILLFACALFTCDSEIVVVPKRMRHVFSWICTKVIILSLIGSFYMVVVSMKAIDEAADKKKWDAEIAVSKNKKHQPVKNEVNPIRQEEAPVAQGRLTINDCFAQAFASYYYCYSNEVSRILAQHEKYGKDAVNCGLRASASWHYKGLKNIEYSFIGSTTPDECDDDDESYDWEGGDEDVDEEGCFDDFLSNKKLDVDVTIVRLFREYVKTIRQEIDSADDGRDDVGGPFEGNANEIRRKLFDLFETMKLHIDWGYVRWINRPRE